MSIKNKKKLRILILLALVIFNLNTFILNLYDNNPTSKESTCSDKNIKMSTNHAPIHINGNWSAAKAAGICTGSGTYNYPYIIENFEIDGGGSGSGIIIENSDVYFKVENCTFINSGSQSNDAGIYLYNIDNGQLINNTCSNNNNYGILLDCYNNNNTISGNIVNSNALVGIYLNYYSNNNTIFNNTCSNNRIFGIYLWYSNNNIISGNIANNNGNGIYLAYSNNNTISRNIANNNDDYGIYFYNSNKNTLKGNLMIECGVYIQGSLVETSSQNIDTTNLVNGKPLYYCTNETFLKSNNFPNAGQLILVNCNDSLIVDLDISSGSLGILLSYGKNNTISNNTCSNNNLGGIKLYNSNKNTISGNTVNNNYEYGICLDPYSNNNTISGNTANNNYYYGIEIGNSDINTISGNTVNNNSNGGIRLYYSNNNIISGNIANNNGNGINLAHSNNNTISRNIANNNGNEINLAHSNNNTIYFNNLVNNTKNVYCVDSTNKWNSPEKIAYTYNNKDYTNYLGNYWDNYTGIDTDNDGIGDTPYIIEGDEKDNFPLMEPFENYLKPSADTTAPAAINDLVISNPTANSITLTWTAPGDDENTGTATGYVVKYSTSGSINDSNWDSATTYGQSWIPLTAGSIETHVVSGLNSNTQYWFAIKAYDEISNYGNISNSPSGKTAAVVFTLSTGWDDKELFCPIYYRSHEQPDKVMLGVYNKRDMWYLVKVYKRQTGLSWEEFIPNSWADSLFLSYLPPYSEKTFLYSPKVDEEIKIEVKNDLNDETLTALWSLDFAMRALIGVSISPQVTDPAEFFVKCTTFYNDFLKLGGYLGSGQWKEAALQFAKTILTNSEAQKALVYLFKLMGKDFTVTQIVSKVALMPFYYISKIPLWASLIGNTNKEPFIEEVIFTPKVIIPQPTPDVRITKSLDIVQDAPYYIGENINAQFTIKNEGAAPITFNFLTVGGRGPYGDADVRDFTFKLNITLNPTESYDYHGELKLLNNGSYHFFIAYQTTDGEWIVNVPTEENILNTLDITVNPIPEKWIGVELHSPAELKVVDSQDQITGYINGVKYNEIPHSACIGNIIVLYLINDSYRYQIVGINKGTYNLTIMSPYEENITIFTAISIPTSGNTIHQYTIDWDILSKDGKGVTLQIDSNGDGIFERTITCDKDLTGDEISPPLIGLTSWIWMVIGVSIISIIIIQLNRKKVINRMA